MAKLVLMDELHLSFWIEKGLSEEEAKTIRKTLREATFRRELKRAVRKLALRFPNLRSVRIKLSR